MSAGSNRARIEAEIASVRRELANAGERQVSLNTRLRRLRVDLHAVAQAEPRAIPGLAGGWRFASSARTPTVGWLLCAQPWKRVGTRSPSRDERDELAQLELGPLDHAEAYHRGDGERCVVGHPYTLVGADTQRLARLLEPLGLRWAVYGRRSRASWYGAGYGLELGTLCVVVARAALVRQLAQGGK